METVEEPPLLNSSIDGIKASVALEESAENSVVSVQANVCHKSNGVAESAETLNTVATEPETPPVPDPIIESETISTEVVNSASEIITEETQAPSETVIFDGETNTETTDPVPQENEVLSGPHTEKTEVIEEAVEDIEKDVSVHEGEKEGTTISADGIVEPVNDRLFQTEILIETNDNESGENVVEEMKVDEQDTAGILNELGENIELTEALRSSDITDNVENNNCAARQEVFNKEELLDILEGNDEELPCNVVTSNLQNLPADKIVEAKMALEQLSRLKTKTKKTRSVDKQPKISVDKQPKIKRSERKVVKQYQKNNTTVKKEENLINVIVKEWEDDEPAETEQSTKLLEESEDLLQSSSELVEAQETVTSQDESIGSSLDSTTVDEKTPNLKKNAEESQPQRRLGRVIKKKVIFDPDNPDTFTKSKMTVNKNKEQGQEKDYPTPKKIKTEQTFQQSKPTITKLQWKKPIPKSCKTHKRLSEVDKLLMDEGAVNMIYQLTPEAPKGKKNMKTKAEFIKKIQSSTPDSKEMKFRERKKECKYEDGEAKKILGGKQRSSLSSSVKSPSVTEDFEAHSADDSIIYRRHSSSSYSSSCMSPRRLSDVEVSGQPATAISQTTEIETQALLADALDEKPTVDIFMSDSTDSIGTDVINKDDCLSIKEKLNSKLNLALNKRKRENSKVDKPLKIKKVVKTDDRTAADSEDFKYLSVMFDGKLAEICIRKSGSKCNIEVLKEIENALTLVDSRKDISVTLITSECGTLCSDLDLRCLLDNDMEKRTNYAYSTAESVRSLLQAMQHHSKLVCSAVNGRCSGVGLAMIGLSDVALASERASFSMVQKSHASAAPVAGISVFSAYRLLPKSLLNDLVVFGRRLSAAEALHGGLVSRTLWPERFYEQVRAIAKDITAQSTQNILLKKQLLNLKKCGSESTFLTCLERERDLLVEYWTSVEGQEVLRTLYNTS